MMRFSCILFTIYFYWCKLYRSRSKALYVGLFRAIPSYTLLMQAAIPACDLCRNSAECPDVMDPERGSVSSGAVVALCRTVAGRVPACKCRAERVQLRGRLVPLQGYQVRSGEVQRSSAEPGLSGATRGLQVLPGSVDSCYPSPRSYAQLR